MHYKAKKFVTKAHQTVEGTMASFTYVFLFVFRSSFPVYRCHEKQTEYLSRWIRLYLPIFFETKVSHRDGLE